MREKLMVRMTVTDWELEKFQQICDEQCGSMEMMFEQFVKWCIEDAERAEDWLREELG